MREGYNFCLENTILKGWGWGRGGGQLDLWRYVLIKSYNKFLHFLRIFFTKWEQNNRELDAYINNNYTKLQSYEDYFNFDTEQAETTKLIEKRNTSLPQEQVKNAYLFF